MTEERMRKIHKNNIRMQYLAEKYREKRYHATSSALNMSGMPSGSGGEDNTMGDVDDAVDIEDELYIIADMTPKELLEIGEGDLLYFYDFTPSDMLDVEYNALNYPIEEVDKPVNIGYINDDTLSKTIIKEERKLAINLKIFLTLTIYYSLSSIIDKIKKEKDKKLNLTTN